MKSILERRYWIFSSDLLYWINIMGLKIPAEPTLWREIQDQFSNWMTINWEMQTLEVLSHAAPFWLRWHIFCIHGAAATPPCSFTNFVMPLKKVELSQFQQIIHATQTTLTTIDAFLALEVGWQTVKLTCFSSWRLSRASIRPPRF